MTTNAETESKRTRRAEPVPGEHERGEQHQAEPDAGEVGIGVLHLSFFGADGFSTGRSFFCHSVNEPS